MISSSINNQLLVTSSTFNCTRYQPYLSGFVGAMDRVHVWVKWSMNYKECIEIDMIGHRLTSWQYVI